MFIEQGWMWKKYETLEINGYFTFNIILCLQGLLRIKILFSKQQKIKNTEAFIRCRLSTWNCIETGKSRDSRILQKLLLLFWWECGKIYVEVQVIFPCHAHTFFFFWGNCIQLVQSIWMTTKKNSSTLMFVPAAIITYRIIGLLPCFGIDSAASLERDNNRKAVHYWHNNIVHNIRERNLLYILLEHFIANQLSARAI